MSRKKKKSDMNDPLVREYWLLQHQLLINEDYKLTDKDNKRVQELKVILKEKYVSF